MIPDGDRPVTGEAVKAREDERVPSPPERSPGLSDPMAFDRSHDKWGIDPFDPKEWE
jgi:hypothetical protein